MLGTKIYKNNKEQMKGYPKTAQWCNKNGATIEDKGDYYEAVALPLTTLDEVKESVLADAKASFAARRDAVRWVNRYGFDCAPEDITNFMAAYTPLLVAGEGSTQYKVWLTEQTKGIVTLTLEDMTKVYHSVRSSQLEAYVWYEGVKAQIMAVQTIEELDAVTW